MSNAARPADFWRLVVAVLGLLALLCLLTALLVGCETGDDEAGRHQLVIAVDRTGVAQADSWKAEVAAQTQTGLERGIRNGVDQVSLLSIGSNTNQSATVATADLTSIEGNTPAKRATARQALINDISAAAAQVAAQPVETSGTDVSAAIEQAASLCHAPEVTECSVLLISDLEDQRVTGAPSAEEAITSLTALMPDLEGISVQVSGLGASGADAAMVQKVKTVWSALFEQAGAVDLRIARSL